jgi:hypothetical protein
VATCGGDTSSVGFVCAVVRDHDDPVGQAVLLQQRLHGAADTFLLLMRGYERNYVQVGFSFR